MNQLQVFGEIEVIFLFFYTTIQFYSLVWHLGKLQIIFSFMELKHPE